MEGKNKGSFGTSKKSNFESSSSQVSGGQDFVNRVTFLPDDCDKFICKKQCVKPNPPTDQLSQLHRHSMKDCDTHEFCSQAPMKAMDGTQRDQDEKMPSTGDREIDRKLRSILFHDNQFVGFDAFRAQNNDEDYFGKEQPIPDDRKLLVTEDVMAAWLASHWGFTLDDVPRRPSTMHPAIYKYIQKIYLKHGGPQAQKKDKGKKKAKKPAKKKKDDKANKQMALGNEIPYQHSPDVFDLLTYPEGRAIESYVGEIYQKMKEEEERENRRREAQKNKRREKSKKSEAEGSASPDRSESSPVNLKLSSPMSAKKIPSVMKSPSKLQRQGSEKSVPGDSEDVSPMKDHLNLEEVEVVEKKERFQLNVQCSLKLDESNTYKVPNEFIRNRIKSEPLGWMNYLEIERAAKEKLDVEQGCGLERGGVHVAGRKRMSIVKHGQQAIISVPKSIESSIIHTIPSDYVPTKNVSKERPHTQTKVNIGGGTIEDHIKQIDNYHLPNDGTDSHCRNKEPAIFNMKEEGHVHRGNDTSKKIKSNNVEIGSMKDYQHSLHFTQMAKQLKKEKTQLISYEQFSKEGKKNRSIPQAQASLNPFPIKRKGYVVSTDNYQRKFQSGFSQVAKNFIQENKDKHKTRQLNRKYQTQVNIKLVEQGMKDAVKSPPNYLLKKHQFISRELTDSFESKDQIVPDMFENELHFSKTQDLGLEFKMIKKISGSQKKYQPFGATVSRHLRRRARSRVAGINQSFDIQDNTANFRDATTRIDSKVGGHSRNDTRFLSHQQSSIQINQSNVYHQPSKLSNASFVRGMDSSHVPRIQTGKLRNIEQRSGNGTSAIFDKLNQTQVVQGGHADSPRVQAGISRSDFTQLLGKHKEKQKETSRTHAAQLRERRTSARSTNLQARSAAHWSKVSQTQQMFVDQFSGPNRIKNERLTSDLLLDQQSLAHILSDKYSLQMEKKDLPLYTKIDMLKGQNADTTMSATWLSQTAPKDKLFSSFGSKGAKNYASIGMQSQSGPQILLNDQTIAQDSHAQMERNMNLSPDIQSLPLNLNDSSNLNWNQTNKKQFSSIPQPETEAEETTLNITYENIKNHYGLKSCNNSLGGTAIGSGREYQSQKMRTLGQLNNKSNSGMEVGQEAASKRDDQSQGEDVKVEELMAKHQSTLKKNILYELNQSIINMHKNEEKCIVEDVNVSIELYHLDLSSQNRVPIGDFKDTNFWLQQSQIRKLHPEDWETAIDFLAQGLRELPLSLKLLYNYACVLERLCRYTVAIKFFGFCQEIRPRWTSALFGQAVTWFKLGKFLRSRDCVEIAIKHFQGFHVDYEKADAEQEEEKTMRYFSLIYFRAMCYKNIGDTTLAERDYRSLLTIFKDEEGKGILNHVVQAIMLPLQENRQKQYEFMNNTINLISFFQPVPTQDKASKLEQYKFKDGRNNQIDMKSNWFNVCRILEKKAFFNRFNRDILTRYIGRAELEYFEKDKIIFLKDRVGVISHGSVRVVSHQYGIMNQRTIGRYKEGRIIGHGESDNLITVNPQTWFIVFDEGTEVLFFKKQDFNELWGLQSMQQSKIILNAILQMNKIWQNFSLQTQMHLIFENLEVRKFRPGELIAQMSKRSLLNRETYGKYYSTVQNQLKEHLEKAKLMEGIKSCQKKFNKKEEEPDNKGDALMSNYVRQLTKPSKGGFQSKVDNQGNLITEKDKGSHQAANDIAVLQMKKQAAAGDEHAVKDYIVAAAKEDAKATAMSKGGTAHKHEEECAKYIDPSVQKQQQTVERTHSKKHVAPDYRNYLAKLIHSFKDHKYKEVDGLYIIYQGYVDIIDPKTQKPVHKIGNNDNFGESEILKQSGYEYLGDLYAGLYPTPEILRNPEKYKNKSRAKINIQRSKDKDEAYFDAIKDTLAREMKVTNIVATPGAERNKLIDIIQGADDCVLTCYIPYHTILDIVPTNELRKIKEDKSIGDKREGVINFIAGQHGIKSYELGLY